VEHDMGPMGIYTIFGRGDAQWGGIYKGQQGAHWLGYVRVKDLDGTVERVKDARGACLAGPMEVPGGDRIAQLRDPYGALFAVHLRAADAARGRAEAPPPREAEQPVAASAGAASKPGRAAAPRKKAAAKKKKKKVAARSGKKSTTARKKRPARKKTARSKAARSKAAAAKRGRAKSAAAKKRAAKKTAAAKKRGAK